MNWCSSLKKEVRFCEPLSKHTTLKIGGIADIWFEPHNLRSLKKILNSCRKKGIPFLVIGEGSNLLVREGGVRGVVGHLSSLYFKRLDFNNNSVIAGCGVRLENLVDFAKQKHLGGCEFLTGIPGTVGGALITNAGARCIFLPKKKRRRSIGDIVEEVTVINSEGKVITLKRKEIRFGYRCSSLDKFIILKVKIKLEKRQPREIEKAREKFISYKKKTQELSRPSAGCIFKNPSHNRTAAELIESCGLKGFRIGDAQISPKHANFIINRKAAKAPQVLALIRFVQDRVRARYGIELKPEIRIVGED